jgi:tetratricopeptide (TPR) repeat protein
VAWQLTEAGYTVELDSWDWHAGQNFVAAMSDALDRSDRVVALFSAAYFDRSRNTTQEWQSSLQPVPEMKKDRLIPVRVENVPPAKVPALLRPLLYRDLFGITEEEARQVLLDAVAGPRRPDREPVFPGRGVPGKLSRQGESAPRLPGRWPRVWNIPPRNPGFTGRDGVLETVREQLLGGEKAVVQALDGIGGVGKTQVAIEYAHRFARTYDLAWWVATEQPTLIADQFAVLAKQLGCPEADGAAKLVQAAVLRELRLRDQWLLVFDNAGNPEDVREWLPSGNGHVLITSRVPGWQDIAIPVHIDVLDRAESVAFLCERVRGLTETDAGALAEQLGDLPLAMAQAAAFMAETGTTASTYLGLLETRARRMMQEGRPGGYPMSLAAATELTAQRLAEKDPAAAELATLCAFLAPEPIPLDMITSAAAELPAALASRAADPVDWATTLAQFSRGALARIGQGTLQMHRLTQAILRDSLTAAQAVEMRARTEAILAASDPGKPDDLATWPRWAEVMPHLLAADLAGGNRALRATAGDVCWYLLTRGNARSGYDLASRLYRRWRDGLGADDPDTLMAAHYRAWALADLGDYAAARELDEDTLERRRRVLTVDHHSTLTTASNLVASLGQLGQLAAAKELAEDTLDRRRRVLGEDDPDTLVSASNLADVLRELGEAQAARALDEDTLARRRRVLGENHHSTLVSASNLAADLRDLGQLEQARHLGEDALRGLRRVLGEDHPLTLACASDLAATLRALGETRAARDLEDDSQARLRRVQGEDDQAPGSSAG